MEHRCTECGEVAAEPRLRYCEECGAKMPEYKPPPLVGGGRPPGGGAVGRPRSYKPAYTGPKWLEHVPAHSPTVLGVILHVLALVALHPPLAGRRPALLVVPAGAGSVPVIAREYRLANEPNPLVDWVPETFYPPYVVAAYASLARGAGAADAGVQRPAAAVDWRHPAGDAGPVVQGVLGPGRRRGRLFEPRQRSRQRVLALAGVAVCLLSALSSRGPSRAKSPRRPTAPPRSG